MSNPISGYELAAVCSDGVTCQKAAELSRAGLVIVGFVLMERHGARRIVDSGQVRFLNKDEARRLMNPPKP